jgi:5'-3' exonuclease
MSALIVDAFNLYTRQFLANPAMNIHGEQIGGCIGFLHTVKRLSDELKPKKIYVVWEGGGSSRRRALFPDYKAQRKPEKLNRFYEDDIPETEENRQQQIIKLLEFLKASPICQLYVANCEADDVIAHLVTGPLKGQDITIASSDRDFYQLLRNRIENEDGTTKSGQVKIYNFHKKLFITEDDVFKEFQVTPENFAIAKALSGDKSDNIPGVKGIGFKTVAKRFPFLGSKKDLILQDIFDYCHTHADETPAYQRILEEADKVKLNWKLVFLNGNMMSASQTAQIDHIIETYIPSIDKIRFIRALNKEGINSFDAHNYFLAFHCIEGLTFKTTGKNGSK